MNSNTSWHSIKEQGTQRGIAILIACYSVGGAWLFRAILFPVMCFYFLLKKDARKASALYLQNLYQFQNQSRKPLLRHSFYHFWQFGQSLLDKFRVWMGDIKLADVQLTGGQYIDDLIAQQRGGIIFISHLGNFEVCHALSSSRPNLRLTILHHSKHTAKFNQVLSRYVESDHVEMMQVTDINIGTAIRLSEKIENGEFIAIAADRVPISNNSAVEPIDFLGKPAPFPSGPFTLALTLKAPMLSLHCIKVDGQYQIHFNPLNTPARNGKQNREHAKRQLMSEYVLQLQQFCLQAPSQWFNFYDFWNTPAAKEKPANDR